MKLSELPYGPFCLALYLGSSGVRKGSLSPSGGLAAFLVGLTMLAVPLRAFGVALVAFYLAGSKATKHGAARKARLEDGHAAAGNRSAAQVLCNSFSALVAAVLWSALFVPGSVAAAALGRAGLVVPVQRPYDPAAWCPLSPRVADGWSRVLLFVTLGHFACCLGDTLASELGILAPSPPRLITTLKPVPPGTNGGVSFNGLVFSAGGGTVIGFVLALSLLLESSACRTEWKEVVIPMLAFGSFAGLFGSLLDSLLGATIQRTKFSEEKKLILTDESPAQIAGVRVISGLDVLSNNQVNLVSSIATALLMGKLAV